MKAGYNLFKLNFLGRARKCTYLDSMMNNDITDYLHKGQNKFTKAEIERTYRQNTRRK
jgi:hypothetical protein